MSLPPGATLGPYQVVDTLGRGGMATVYKGYQPLLGRHVAIKVLSPALSDDESFRTRFRTEALTIARLRHPNILQVHDFGDDGGHRYLVLELVDGGTLAERVGRPWPAEQVVTMLAPVADALDYAHGQGVLHRDVKPSNVLIARDGRPILADFGLARMVGSARGLTRTGILVGTPEYMSPEQAAGEDATAATDRYALAVIAYEMLFGRVPYRADSPLSTLLAHLQKPLPLSSDDGPRLSRQVESVLLSGLAKRPGDRYGTAAAFVGALRAALEDGIVTGQPASPPPTTRVVLAEPTTVASPARPRLALRPFLIAAALGALVLQVSSAALSGWPAAAPEGSALTPEIGPGLSSPRAGATRLGSLVATIGAGESPSALAVDGKGDRVYVVDSERAALLVIDAARNAVVATISVGKKPSAVAVDPTSGNVYVTNAEANTLSVIDASRSVVVATIPVGRKPSAVAVEPASGRVYVANAEADSLSVVDIQNRKVVGSIAVGRKPSGIALHAGRGRVYVSNSDDADIAVVDIGRNAVVATIRVGKKPTAVAVHEGRSRLYVANTEAHTVSVIDGVDGVVVASVEVGKKPSAIAVDPARDLIYVVRSEPGGLSALDATTNTIVGDIPLGGQLVSVAVGTTGRVYVADRKAGVVSVIE